MFQNALWRSATFGGKPQLDPHRVHEAFGREWKEKFGTFTEYGQDAKSGHWTYLISGNGPTSVTDLKFAWDYVDPLHEKTPLATTEVFEQRFAAIAERLKEFGAPRLSASLSPPEAARRAKELHELKAKCAYDAVIVLRAPNSGRFDGKQIWDVMLCLGLKWGDGDMDCFHWPNPGQVGGDYLFSVATSTPPGYFLPEEIAAGRVHVADLVFSFSVPRSDAPAAVFDAMLKGTEYCQKRLGGRITDETDRPIDASAARKRIAEVESDLKKAGFSAGSHDALRLF